VREVAQLGGSIQGLVPLMVEQRLKEKLDPAIKLRNARSPREERPGKTKGRTEKRTGKRK
jgi:hypothetical protein